VGPDERAGVEEEGEGLPGEYVVDLVETFFTNLDLRRGEGVTILNEFHLLFVFTWAMRAWRWNYLAGNGSKQRGGIGENSRTQREAIQAEHAKNFTIL